MRFVSGAFFVGVDVEAHSFTAGADYRIYAATMTGFRGGSADTLTGIIASNGTTLLETDAVGGAIGSASNIATATSARTAISYVRVRQFNTTSLPGAIRPYDLYVRALSGSPMPEMEPKDEGAPRAPCSNGWMSPVIGPATAKKESFAIMVNGGDLIGVIVAIEQRGAPVWKVIAGSGVFTGSFILTLYGGGRRGAAN